MNIKTKSQILNILFNDEEFVIITLRETQIFNLSHISIPSQTFETLENPYGLCSMAKDSPSHFLILGQSIGEILFYQSDVSSMA